MVTEQEVMNVMRSVFDPEIPVNVVDLGLIYDVSIEDDVVSITMTMTAPGCPFGDQLSASARDRILTYTEAKDAIVTMVIDPPWNQSMMNEDAQKALGMF